VQAGLDRHLVGLADLVQDVADLVRPGTEMTTSCCSRRR
jgi:hypothetical protein